MQQDGKPLLKSK